MSRTVLSFLVAAGLALLAPFASFADEGSATVSKVVGTALVNRGDGFKPVSEGAKLKVGDKIMPKGGSVTVRTGSCSYAVQEGTIFAIPDSVCGLAGAVNSNPAAGAGAGGGGTAAAAVAAVVGIGLTATTIAQKNGSPASP
jgi:hypothetical protein